MRTALPFVLLSLSLATLACRNQGNAEPQPQAVAPTAPSSAPAEPATPVVPQYEAAWLACQQDADCVPARADCCGCAGGGSDTAVNRTHLKDAQAAASSACKDVLCTAAVGTHPSCTARARCKDAVCMLDETAPSATQATPTEPIKKQ